MDHSSEPIGAAFLCDADGVIRQVIRNDLGLAGAPGQPLSGLVDRSSFTKLLNLLVELRTRGAALDWELNAALGDEVTSLHFAGVRLDDRILIVAARTRNGALELYEEMMRINNEQMNLLRAAAKENAEQTASLYDEISRLNNELVNMQRELAKKNAELEKLNEQKNRFLGMAAHDLRAPLSVIIMYSEFLMDEVGDALSQEQAEFLAIIHSSSEWMRTIVNDWLDIAAIEAGALRLDRQPEDLAALVERNLARNRPLAARKNIRLEAECQDGLPPVCIDAHKIDQVLDNLISNAVKFSHPGSAITVRLAAAPGGVVLSVRDEGVGIPPEKRERLFKPYERAHDHGTGGERGTGLGLAIVNKIVTGHGGRVRVESEPGKGTTFEVWLPVSVEPNSGS